MPHPRPPYRGRVLLIAAASCSALAAWQASAERADDSHALPLPVASVSSLLAQTDLDQSAVPQILPPVAEPATKADAGLS